MNRLRQSSVRIGLAVGCAMVAASVLSAQKPALHYPAARRDAVVDNYFGTRVPAPYRWMENLDSPEVKRWVLAENRVTSAYLASLPQRDPFRKRITASIRPPAGARRSSGRRSRSIRRSTSPSASSTIRRTGRASRCSSLTGRA